MKTFLSCAVILAACVGAIVAAEAEKAASAEELVAKFLAENDAGESLRMVVTWEDLPVAQKLAIMDELMKQLASTRKLAITNTGNISVRSRVESGEMKEYGMGGRSTKQDFFIVGGKAAWAIELMLSVPSTGIIEKMPDDHRKSAIIDLEVLVRIYKKGVNDGRASAETSVVPKKAP